MDVTTTAAPTMSAIDVAERDVRNVLVRALAAAALAAAYRSDNVDEQQRAPERRRA